MTLLSVYQECGKGLTHFATGTYQIVSTTEGLKRLTAFVLPIFELIGKFWEKVPSALTILNTTFTSFSEFTIVYSLAKRLKICLVPDEDTGKRLWETAWQNIATTLSSIVADIATALSYLKNLKLISLGKAATSIALVGTVASAAAGVFDTWHSANDIASNSLKSRKALRLKQEYLHLHNNITENEEGNNKSGEKAWQQHVDGRIEFYQQRLAAFNPLEAGSDARQTKATAKQNQWKLLKNASPLEVKTYCGKKAERWSIVAKNSSINQSKSWIGIAINLANLVLIGLSFFLAVAPFIQIPLIALTILTNGVDLSSILVDTFLKNQVVPSDPLMAFKI